MLRKVISIMLIIAVISSGTVYASEGSDPNIQTIEELSSFVKELKVNNKEVTEMMKSEGFSYIDARYYYILDQLVDYMIENEISLDLSNVEPMNNSEIASDISGFRNKVLSIDVGALGTALMNTELYAKSSPERLGELVALYGKDIPKKIIVKNPDGSTIEYSNTAELITDTVSEMNNQVQNTKLHNSEKDVLGLVTNTWETSSFDNGYGTYNGTAEVKLTAPSAYTKLRIETNTTWSSSGVTANSVDAYTATYGTIFVSNKLNYVDNYATSAKATGDVVWLIQGSVGATFGGVVSFSVSAGATWTELLQKIYYDDGDWECKTSVYY